MMPTSVVMMPPSISRNDSIIPHGTHGRMHQQYWLSTASRSTMDVADRPYCVEACL